MWNTCKLENDYRDAGESRWRIAGEQKKLRGPCPNTFISELTVGDRGTGVTFIRTTPF